MHIQWEETRQNSNVEIAGKPENTLKDPSYLIRMLVALERKNELNPTIHVHRSYQKLAPFYLKMGNTEKVQHYTTFTNSSCCI